MATEHQEQTALIEWVSLQKNRDIKLLFAIPNGGARHIVAARKLKAEGVSKGVPDLFLPVPRKGYHGLFLEMKKSSGVPSDVKIEQKTWLFALQEQGFCVTVCFGFYEAKEVLNWYIERRRVNVYNDLRGWINKKE